MRALEGAIAVLLAVFAALQHNDPDAARWIVLYGAAAGWSAAAAWRPEAVARRPWSWLLAASLAVVLAVLIRAWPEVDAWWRVSVWWEVETAREQLGLLIVLAALGLAAVSAARAR